MYLCIFAQDGQIVYHENLLTAPEAFLEPVAPYRHNPVVGVERVFTWYWVADLCRKEGIELVLGHALYTKAIHGVKVKNDKVAPQKIAGFLRGGMFPKAFVYPSEMRPTRDPPLRRRYFVRRRADLLAHIQNTNSQYNMPGFGKKIARRMHREGIVELLPHPAVQQSIAIDIESIDQYDRIIEGTQDSILRTARSHDAQVLSLLRSVPGIDKARSLVLLYEIHDIERFERVQDFCFNSRLVKRPHESAGKRSGKSWRKIGNVHLEWAFSEASVLFQRANPGGMKHKKRLERKHGKGKALSILSHRLGPTVYFLLKRRKAFDMATSLVN